MNLSTFRRFSAATLCVGLLVLGGCTVGGTEVTFLDFVNTILLGIAAAGGVILIRND